MDDSTEEDVLPEAIEVSLPSGSTIEPIDFHSSKSSVLVSIRDATLIQGSAAKLVKITLSILAWEMFWFEKYVCRFLS